MVTDKTFEGREPRADLIVAVGSHAYPDQNESLTTHFAAHHTDLRQFVNGDTVSRTQQRRACYFLFSLRLGNVTAKSMLSFT